MRTGNQKSHLVICTTILALALTLVACSGATTETVPATPTAQPRTLVISGSGTTTLILNAVKPAFEAGVPGYTLDVLSGSGTKGGIQGAIEGVLDAAATARPLTDDEAGQGWNTWSSVDQAQRYIPILR